MTKPNLSDVAKSQGEQPDFAPLHEAESQALISDLTAQKLPVPYPLDAEQPDSRLTVSKLFMLPGSQTKTFADLVEAESRLW